MSYKRHTYRQTPEGSGYEIVLQLVDDAGYTRDLLIVSKTETRKEAEDLMYELNEQLG